VHDDAPVCDAQVHVWAPNSPERPWADPVHGADHRFPSLSAEQLIAHMDEAGVAQAALVPPAFEGDRPDLALDAARRWPQRFVAVLRVPLRDEAAGRALVRSWRSTPGLGAVRVTFTREKRTWLLDGTADWFWREAETADVPVMAYAPGATRDLARVAAAHDRLRIAIDHFGLEGRLDAAGLDEAARELERAASLPNLGVKASALPLHVDEPFPFPSLHDPLRRVVAAFGPERVFWGSDMSRHGPSYREALAWVREVDGLGDDALAWVLGRGIRRWLGLERPG
jgi:predicted TIM-barrel fold metal-dependent hydrolase